MSNIVVPVLGESIVEARIAKWLKKPGDHVEVGDPLVELETEKTNLELSAEKRGVITSIARNEGEDVKIGELLAVVDENGAGAPPAAAQSGNGSKAAAAPEAAPPPAAQAAPAAPAESPKSTPTARRMAQDHEVDLGGVQGTGSAGRVTKQDVKNAIAPTAPTTSDTLAPTSDKLAPTRESKIAPTSARPLGPTRSGDRTEERVRMTKRRCSRPRPAVAGGWKGRADSCRGASTLIAPMKSLAC